MTSTGGVGRMLEMARASLLNIPRVIGARWWRRPMRDGRDRSSPARELVAKRAAWSRFRAAFNALNERRAAFASSPSDLTAEQVRWAEVELEDAVAVAGEFQVYDLPWSLA
jgi:hypothetical protein